MSRILLLCCLLGISLTLFNSAEARSARRLEGEGIQGGSYAREGQFPYQISLETDGQSICGGSILTERFVVTAAHCVIDEDGKFMNLPLKVVAGIEHLKFRPKTRVAVDVVKVYVPREYDPTVVENQERSTGDIAILKLRRDLDIEGNPNLGTVELPMKGETYEGKKAIVSGFGLNEVDVIVNPFTGEYDEVNGKRYNKMRYARAEVLSYDDCQDIFGDVLPIDRTHLCAAVVQHYEDQPEGVCSGDSGGPLVYNGALIGIVSTSPLGCQEDMVPAVYTRVSDYLNFIDAVLSGKIGKDIRTNYLDF